MKILIYGINYIPEFIGIGKYSGEMAEWLSKQCHDVRVITAPPYYPQWLVAEGYHAFVYKRESVNGLTVIRCPLYVPNKPTKISRLLHLFSFAFSSFPIVLAQIRWQPDIIICVEPTFFCTPTALILAKLSGAKSILHIQDYEFDAMLGLGMGKPGLFWALAQGIERFVMQHFSAISSISASMLKRASEKMTCKDQESIDSNSQFGSVTLTPSKLDMATASPPSDQIDAMHNSNDPHLIMFPNWVDIDFVTPDADADIFRQKWKIPKSCKVVLYSGNMGKKQGLELVLDVAVEFDKQQDVVFIFVGTGAAVVELQHKANALKLQNSRFFPLQDYEDLPSLMALADVHLVVQKKGIADAVLPSKLTTILSAGGQALITAEKDTELGLLCDTFPGIARCVEPENLAAFSKALTELLKQVDVNHRVPNYIARSYAERYLGKEQVLSKFERDLKCVLSHTTAPTTNKSRDIGKSITYGAVRLQSLKNRLAKSSVPSQPTFDLNRNKKIKFVFRK